MLFSIAQSWCVHALSRSCACRDGELLELGAFAGGDLACEFPGADVMSAFQELYRLDLSGNRISGK